MDFIQQFAQSGPEPILFVVFLGVLLTVLLVGYALMTARSGPRQRLRGRVDRAKGVADPRYKPGQVADIKINTDYSSIGAFDKLLRRFLPRPALLRRRLANAGLRISLGTYVLINLVIVAIVVLAVMKLFKMGGVSSGLAGLAMGVGLPHMIVSMLISRRLMKFIKIFPEAIDLIVRGLKSGLPVMESIRVVGREMPAPVGPEFDQVADAVKFGKTLDEALWSACDRLDTPEFKFFVISLSIQQETGGNLAETLENLSDILRKRKQMRLKVKAMSSEARASAMIIGALPFVMFGLIWLVNSGYLMTLFTDPRGLMMTIFVLALMATGAGVMYKMVKFEI